MTLIKVEREFTLSRKALYFATVELKNRTVIKIPIRKDQFLNVYGLLYQDLQEQLNDGFGERREMI